MKDKCCNCPMTKIACLLVIIGALNWGLVGVMNFDVVQWLFVDKINYPTAANVVYVLVGLSGLFLAVKKIAKCCKGGSCSTK